MKKFLAATLLFSIITISGSCVQPAISADSQNNSKGSLSVSYTVEKVVSPDTVEVSVEVKTSDKKSMQEAANKNKEISNSVYEYLKANIKSSNGDYIKTSNYSARPLYNYQNGKKIFDKYEVVNNIIVHTKSLDNISKMIDKSISLGATNINSLNFTLSNKDSQCADALASAAKQVKERGNFVASAIGTSIAGIKNINTSCSVNQSRTSYGYSNMMLMAKSSAMVDEASGDSSTNIESGNIKIYANVDAEFYVK